VGDPGRSIEIAEAMFDLLSGRPRNQHLLSDLRDFLNPDISPRVQVLFPPEGRG